MLLCASNRPAVVNWARKTVLKPNLQKRAGQLSFSVRRISILALGDERAIPIYRPLATDLRPVAWRGRCWSVRWAGPSGDCFLFFSFFSFLFFLLSFFFFFSFYVFFFRFLFCFLFYYLFFVLLIFSFLFLFLFSFFTFYFHFSFFFSFLFSYSFLFPFILFVLFTF